MTLQDYIFGGPKVADLNISTIRTVAWGLPFQELAQTYVVLVVFSPYKMAPHLFVQQRSFISYVYW